VADHHRIDASSESAEHSEFIRLEIVAGNRDGWQLMVRVARTARVSREMLAATEDTRALQRIVKGPCILDHLRRIISVASAPQRIVRVVVERDIEDRTKIEIETEHAQETSRDVAMPPDQREVTAVAELVRVRRLVTDKLQSRNTAAFLVDGDDRLDLTDFPKVIDQLPQLSGRLDVAAKQNEGAGLNAFERRSRFRIEFETGNAGHEKLA
jgi:hypothetical protein